jgi:biopolymer transport protein ExbB
VLLWWGSTATVQAQELIELVQSETRILEQELAALQQQERALQELVRQQVAEGEAEARRLSEEVTTMDLAVAELRAGLQVVSPEDVGESAEDEIAAILGATLEELREHGVSTAPTEASEGALLEAFTAWIDVLRFENQVRVEEIALFGPDGRYVPRAQLMHIGRIAAFARAGDVVAPATLSDDGAWVMLTPVDSTVFAPALERQLVPPLPVRLFENADDTVRRVASEPQTVWEKAGPLAWPLGALGLAAALVVLLKAAQLLWTGRLGTAQDVRPFMDGRSQQADATVLGRLLSRAIARTGREPQALALQLESEFMTLTARWGRGLGSLKVIAASAPLLGLLGTVSGMIDTFDVINTIGTGDARSLSGGIAVALVTTEMGLWIAIPAVLLHTLLSGWVDRRSMDLMAELSTCLAWLQSPTVDRRESGE